VKIEPAPGALSTLTAPPNTLTICLTIQSPRPIPPKFPLLAARSNRPKIRS
jgi:hypothetical protein